MGDGRRGWLLALVLTACGEAPSVAAPTPPSPRGASSPDARAVTPVVDARSAPTCAAAAAAVVRLDSEAQALKLGGLYQARCEADGWKSTTMTCLIDGDDRFALGYCLATLSDAQRVALCLDIWPRRGTGSEPRCEAGVECADAVAAMRTYRVGYVPSATDLEAACARDRWGLELRRCLARATSSTAQSACDQLATTTQRAAFYEGGGELGGEL